MSPNEARLTKQSLHGTLGEPRCRIRFTMRPTPVRRYEVTLLLPLFVRNLLLGT